MKEKVWNNKIFDLKSTKSQSGDTIICGTFENGWKEFGTSAQRWHYPKRIIRNKKGNLFMEVFEIRVSSFRTDWVLVKRTKTSQEVLDCLIDRYITYIESDIDFVFINKGEI